VSTKDSRISKNQYYIDIAEVVYKRSTCLRRKFGAVIVKNNEIIATGYNGAPRGVTSCMENGYCWREKHNIPHGTQYEKCFTVHAEANAIISAARKDMIASTLYLAGENIDGTLCTALPCILCTRLILNAGISKFIFRQSTGSIAIEWPQKTWKNEKIIIKGRYV